MSESPAPRPSRLRTRLIRGTVAVATLTTLFYAVENWRGTRKWNQVQASLSSRGEPLTLEELLPPVPAEENFYAAPIVADRYRNPDTTWFKFKKGSLTDIVAAAKPENSKEDLAAALKLLRVNADWSLPAETGNPAADLLAALAPAEKGLLELRDAVRRPHARMLPGQFDLHVATRGARFLIETVRLHSLRRMALLEAGRQEEAAEECIQALRLARCLTTEPPNLMQFLISGAITQAVLDMLRAGNGSIPWSAPRLQAMDAELATLKFGDRFGGVLRAERVFALPIIEQYASGNAGQEPSLGGMLLPSGWRYQWQATFCEAIQARIDGIAATGLRAESATKRDPGWFPPQPYAIRGEEMQSHNAMMPKALQLDQAVTASRLALATVRWRLEKGTWPDSLSALVPLFPTGGLMDPVSGQSFTGTAAPDGTYTIQPPPGPAGSRDSEDTITLKPPAGSPP